MTTGLSIPSGMGWRSVMRALLGSGEEEPKPGLHRNPSKTCRRNRVSHEHARAFLQFQTRAALDGLHGVRPRGKGNGNTTLASPEDPVGRVFQYQIL